MNYIEYQRKISVLSEELQRAAEAKPFDAIIFNDVADRIYALHQPLFRPKRRRPWSALIFTILLLIVLLWIVLEILSLLWIRGVK